LQRFLPGSSGDAGFAGTSFSLPVGERGSSSWRSKTCVWQAQKHVRKHTCTRCNNILYNRIKTNKSSLNQRACFSLSKSSWKFRANKCFIRKLLRWNGHFQNRRKITRLNENHRSGRLTANSSFRKKCDKWAWAKEKDTTRWTSDLSLDKAIRRSPGTTQWPHTVYTMLYLSRCTAIKKKPWQAIRRSPGTTQWPDTVYTILYLSRCTAINKITRISVQPLTNDII